MCLVLEWGLDSVLYRSLFGKEKRMTHNPLGAGPGLSRSILVCAASYLIAGGVAVVVACALGDRSPILIAACADIAATFVIFGFSTLYRNSSLYDPYWSVAPVPIVLYWAFNPVVTGVNGIRQVLAVSLVTIWAVRLTYNWFRRWEGLKHEDWRYSDLREKMGRRYVFIDLTGIHLFPTIQVFLGCLALYPALSAGTSRLGAVDAVAVLITSGAIWIEATADKQLHRFLCGEKRPGEILNKGLWACSRHPNYFGEIMFWWGLYLLGMAADPSFWWTVIGPLSITLMFMFISIPMIDKRSLERRPGYGDHMQKVSACIPWFPRQ